MCLPLTDLVSRRCCRNAVLRGGNRNREDRQLSKGDKIRLSGLGILQVRDWPALTARNPATGEAVAVAASRKIAFRPAKELKEVV